MNSTQIKKIQDHLLENGSVSRNWALGQFITRLGAIIHHLNDNDWVINGKYVKTERGKDYVYFLDKAPIRKIYYRVNGEIVGSGYEKVS